MQAGVPCAAAAACGAGMGLPEKAGMWKGIRWRMKNSFFRKYKNEFALYRIRKKLLTIIAVLLVVFAMLTMLLFYLSERSSYQKNMAESNEIMASQMASVYELYMQNVKEIAHDTAFNNQELFHLSAGERQDPQAKTKILDMLGSISVMNPYVHSAYLYYEEEGMVYSSISMPYSITPLENFGDKVVFEQDSAAKPYQVAPHLLHSTAAMSDLRKQPLIISYVVPTASRNGTVYLCVNVNTRSLYSMILRDFELEQNKNFYIVDKEGYVVFHRDSEYLFVKQNELPQKDDVIRSEAYSSILGFTFVFESTVPPLESGLLRFSSWILGALCVTMVVAIVSVIYSTLPIRKMVQVAKKSNLRDFLAKSGGSADTTFWDRSMQECKNHVVGVFRIASHADAEEFLNQSIKMSAENEKDYQFLVIKMSGETIAIIFGNIRHYGDIQFRQHVRTQCEKMCATFRAGEKAYCVVSQVKTGVEQLRDGYRECCETFRYQYLFPQQVIVWEKIDTTLPGYPFPVRHERHIINNLMAGKGEACLRHIDEIFADFRSGDYLIKDSEINRYLAVMQENISLRLETLPIPIERPARHGFDACVTLDEVYTVFVGYVHEILVQITNRPREPENNVNTVVLEYIEKNFCQNDICLSKIAEELSLSANLISRIVKEASHRSFSEYITYKRIQRSKELLADGSMSINAVSEAVGFTYPYYFIRKFKELEGVTPGQYIGAQTPSDG